MTLAASLNDAGFSLFRAADRDANLAVSPVSIGLAFGLVHAGSSGELKDALRDYFDYPMENGLLLDAFNSLDLMLASEAGAGAVNSEGETVDLPVVRIANRVFVDEGFEPRQTYLATVSRYFGASAQSLPLSTDAPASRKAIDAWVSERTQGLIERMMPDSLPTPDTRLVLANALYMKANWLHPFNADDTTPRPFTTGTGDLIDADAMRKEMSVRHARGDGFDAVILPYVGNLEMILIVPEKGRLDDVTDGLSQDFLNDLDSRWQHGRAIVQLPVFRSGSSVNLRELVEDRLGATGIFDTDGLDGIGPNLVVSDALHATQVIVDEAGTEAAAVTLGMVSLTGAPMPAEREIIADKPFLYVVRETSTGAVLFVGRIVDPTAE